LSRATASRAAFSSRHSAIDIAFSRSGRLRRTTLTWGAAFSVSTLAMVSLAEGGGE
jgi:hypothetical protein